MEDLFIAKSKYTPEIKFSSSGNLSIKGLSLLENSYELYMQAIDWLTEFGKRAPCDVTFDLKFEYIDTSSVRSIVNLLKMLNGFKEKKFNVKVNWFYERDDEDLCETGEAMKSVSIAEFVLVELSIDDYEV